jgi:hypothetical protein
MLSQGVCATALKRACRKLGVKKWPYRDQQCQSQRTSMGQAEPPSIKGPVRAISGATLAPATPRDSSGSMDADAASERSQACTEDAQDAAMLEDEIARKPLPPAHAVSSHAQAHADKFDELKSARSFNASRSHGYLAAEVHDSEASDDDARSFSSVSDDPGSTTSSISSTTPSGASSPSRVSAPPLNAAALAPSRVFAGGSSERYSGLAATSPASSIAQAHREMSREIARPKTVTSSRRAALAANVSGLPSLPLVAPRSLTASAVPAIAVDLDSKGGVGAQLDGANVIFPRRKQGQHKKHGRKEGVIVTMDILETVFHMPLHKACNELGVCATALKRACRKLGVQKWPYRDQQCQSQRHVSAAPGEGKDKEVQGAAAEARPRCAATQASQRLRAAPSVRENARSAVTRVSSRIPAQHQHPAAASPKRSAPADTMAQELHVTGLVRDNSAGNLLSHYREHSSDFESSVDTHIAGNDQGGAQDEVMTEAPACEFGAPGAVSWGLAEEPARLDTPGEWRYSGVAVAAEEDFDSLDSEEDGLVEDDFDSGVWDLSEARFDQLGAPVSLSLEDCLKV